MRNPIKFFYVRKENGSGKEGVATIATLIVSDGDESIVRIGASFCSPKDQFNKRIGRAMALERMAKDETAIVATFEGHSSESVAKVWGVMDKPEYWRNTQLASDAHGLYIAGEVQAEPDQEFEPRFIKLSFVV